jgi:hypothetical protein
MALISWDLHHNIREGINYLEKAIEYAPDWPMLRHLVARLYLEINDIKSAERHVQKAFELFNPTSHTPLNAIEYYYENIITGRSWTNLQKEFKPCVDQINEIKSKNPTQPQVE